MLSEFACPVCHGDTWQEENDHRYSADDHLSRPARLSDYERLRRRVLFEVWQPEARSVTLRTRLCRSCGFVTYAPRPTEEDIEAKYRFLRTSGDLLGGSPASSLGREMDRLRARRTFSTLSPYLSAPPGRVLDFGGGDGKLLTPFLEAGFSCSVVDYTPETRPGVHKVGDTLRDLSPDDRYDVIVCSHVLEHLARPGEAVARLRDHLTDDGMLYAEVPVEVWRGIPIGGDPVTHVNFFTAGSVQRLLTGHGYRVLRATEGVGTYAQVAIEVAVVVAGRGRDDGPAHGVEEAESRFHPSARRRVAHVLRLMSRATTQVMAVARAGNPRQDIPLVLGKAAGSGPLRRGIGRRVESSTR